MFIRHYYSPLRDAVSSLVSKQARHTFQCNFFKGNYGKSCSTQRQKVTRMSPITQMFISM